MRFISFLPSAETKNQASNRKSKLSDLHKEITKLKKQISTARDAPVQEKYVRGKNEKFLNFSLKYFSVHNSHCSQEDLVAR